MYLVKLQQRMLCNGPAMRLLTNTNTYNGHGFDMYRMELPSWVGVE